MMSRLADLVQLYADQAAPVLSANYGPARCLNGTRVCLDVLRAFGIRTRPVSVDALVMNATFRARLEALGRWPTEAELDEWVAAGGWAVGFDVDPHATDATKNVWAGHLIAVAQQQLLVDSAALSMHRPERGIEVPDIFVGAVRKPFLVGARHAVYESGAGGLLSYRARLTDVSWRDQSGFQPHPDNARVVREIVARMRGRL